MDWTLMIGRINWQVFSYHESNQYNKRFLRSIERDGLKMNLAAIQETNLLTEQEVEFLAGEPSGEKYEKIKEFVNQFCNAKSIGSLIKLEFNDVDFIRDRINIVEHQQGNLFEEEIKGRVLPLFKKLVKQTAIMSQRYDVFISNPPYAAKKYLTVEVANYLTKHYPDVKYDLFSAFIEFSFHSTKRMDKWDLCLLLYGCLFLHMRSYVKTSLRIEQ